MSTPNMKRTYWPTQTWQTKEAAALGMDAEKFKFLDEEIQSRYKNLDGIVVVRKGFIAFENYYNGYRRKDTHNVASVTKSFISALIGIAIDAGYIQSLDQKVLDFFPDYAPPADAFQKRIITLRHLLTMTAPFAWQTGARGFEPLDRLRRQRDWVIFCLNLLGKNGTPGKFQYSSLGAHLLSAIISRSTGMNAREFANQRLFHPLGIKEIPDHDMKSFSMDEVFGEKVKGWVKDPGGITTGGWGLTITARDMARFGFLYLNHGLWEGAQIIPESWIEESTAMNANEYGYFWWLKEEESIFSYAAAGSGGNLICCIPEKDLVVAIGSKITAKPRDRRQLIEEHVLPAIQD
jgi:CubicO group peptidase (beta-lactamase class C family)